MKRNKSILESTYEAITVHNDDYVSKLISSSYAKSSFNMLNTLSTSATIGAYNNGGEDMIICLERRNLLNNLYKYLNICDLRLLQMTCKYLYNKLSVWLNEALTNMYTKVVQSVTSDLRARCIYDLVEKLLSVYNGRIIGSYLLKQMLADELNTSHCASWLDVPIDIIVDRLTFDELIELDLMIRKKNAVPFGTLVQSVTVKNNPLKEYLFSNYSYELLTSNGSTRINILILANRVHIDAFITDYIDLSYCMMSTNLKEVKCVYPFDVVSRNGHIVNRKFDDKIAKERIQRYSERGMHTKLR